MRLPVAVLALLSLAASASAQKPFSKTIWVAPTGYVRIHNMAGSVQVYGWDKDSLQISGSITAPPGGEFKITPGKQGAKVSIWGPAETGVKPSDIVVRVPRGSLLQIKTQSATIMVQGFAGDLDAVSVTGGITVNGKPRELYVESMGGDLNLAVSTRSARAKSGTGKITLGGSCEDATLSTVSGPVLIMGARITQGHFESVEGAIRYTGPFSVPSTLDFINHSGDVELIVPLNAAANFSIDTFSGFFKDEFGVKAKEIPGKLKNKNFTFRIGDEAGADVTIKNFKGSVTLRKSASVKAVM